MRFVVLAFMACILIALGSALYYILKRQENPEKAAKALTLRIGLSLMLFILLWISFAMGWLKPHALFPITNKQTQTEKAIPHPQNANTTPPPQTQNDD